MEVSSAALRVAAGVACAVGEPGAPQQRARHVLDALRPLVPFVGAELAAWDPVAGSYRSLAHEGYSAGVVRRLTGAELLAECAELGMTASGLPMRMRDVPPGARAVDGTIGRLLLPSGYREGLSMCLRTGDGRVVGLLHLSVEDARHPTDLACSAIGLLNAALAHVCDATLSLRWLRSLVGEDDGAVALAPGGRTVELPGASRPRALAAGSGALAVAHALASARARSFLWPSADAAGGWDRVLVIPCREPGAPTLTALATVREGVAVHGLTRRELEVLTLLTRGLSNEAIALSLVVSPRTVAKHAERILAKLGVPTRAAAAARATAEGLLLGGARVAG